jgi:membrane protease YdiL (CAAX protease family)
MKNTLGLIGPTLMVFIGLQLLESVTITFLLFYGWLLWAPIIEKAFPKESFKITRHELIVSIGCGLAFFLFVFGGVTLLQSYLLDIKQLRIILWDWGFSGSSEVWLILILLIVNPILEEVYWRGYMYKKVRSQGKAFTAILITAVFYTLYHLLSVFHIFQGWFGVVAVLPVLIAGVLWGGIREKTGSVTGSIISHALSDLGIVCVYWFIVR